MNDDLKARFAQFWAEHGKLFGELLAEEASELKQTALTLLSKRDFDEAYKAEAQADILERVPSLIANRLK